MWGLEFSLDSTFALRVLNGSSIKRVDHLGRVHIIYRWHPLGIIGEYVGRVFEDVKQRPLYWVKAAINFDGENPEIAYEPSKADIFIANQVPGPEEDKD